MHIPVIGNGDIKTPQDMDEIFRHTNCDGIMIGRAARGNPWLFAELSAHFCGTAAPQKITPNERTAMILRHLDMLIADKGEYIGLREMRKHAAWYTKGQVGGTKLRDKINRAESVAEFKNFILGCVE